MARSAGLIGRGVIVLSVSPSVPSELPTTAMVRYSIQAEGLRFYTPISSRQPQRWFDLQPVLTGGRAFTVTSGHLSLVSLPASPQAAFYNVSMQASDNNVVLTVAHSAPFAQREDTAFKALNISFTELTDGTLQTSGEVILSLLGQDIVLRPSLTPEAGLTFSPSQPQSLEIAQWGQLAIERLNVGAHHNRWADLQTLYAFDNPSGDIFFDSAGQETTINLESVGAAVSQTQGGVRLGPAYLKSGSGSAVGIARLVNACKSSNAITISAWVNPTQLLSKGDRRPARIVSLSKDLGERNFTLGQDIDAAGRNRYVACLRRQGGSAFVAWLLGFLWSFIGPVLSFVARFLPFAKAACNGTPPLASTPFTLPAEGLSQVTFTRDEKAQARIYIDGVEATDESTPIDFSGDFSQWAAAEFSLLLGNETTGDRPWQGEIHQVAIYSRALSATEVALTYFPAIELEASLVLNCLPAPLNAPLSVALDDSGQIKVTQQGLTVTPALTLDDLALEALAGNLSGTVKATLWGNSLTFDAVLTGDQLRLSLPGTRRQSLQLNESDLPPLGEIWLTQLALSVDRTATTPSWTFATDGAVTFATLPHPLKGSFPVEIFLETARLWFGMSPTVPLKLADGLLFDRADLRFAWSESGWQVQPDRRAGHAGIGLPLFEKPLDLDAQLVATEKGKALSLTWTEAADGFNQLPVSEQLGRLNLLNFSLKGNPVEAPLRWQISMTGEVPLGLADEDIQGGVLAFATEEGQILADVKDPRQPAKLQGRSVLKSLNDPIFAGDLTSLENRFFLNGRFDLFPDWSALQAGAEARIEIAAGGQVQFHAPAEVALTDFVMLNPVLALTDGRLTLSGLWLGESVVFTALHRAERTVWAGTAALEIPFSLTLGPIHDPRSGVKLADEIQVCQTPNCRQMMRVNLAIELSSAGFLAQVNSEFTWQDANLVDHDVSVTAFSLFAPPKTRNRLLGHIVKRVEAQADELFGPGFAPTNGYFFAVSGGQAVMYFGSRTQAFDQAPSPTALPNVFKSAATVIADGFTLAQTAAGCVLSLNPEGRSQTDLKASYMTFLQALEEAPLLSGAATLVKSRIAERLPVTLDNLLFYYYGIDADKGQIDLQAGMRLRVDYQNYQFVHPSDPTANAGFVGGGSAYYRLTSEGAGSLPGTISFDAFLSQIQPYVNTDIAKVGAGGGLDTFQAGYQKPYMRLVYPPQAASSRGSLAVEQAAMLMGATSLTALDKNTDVTTFYFRGRATVIPEIEVTLQGRAVYVPVGTSLQQLMEQTVSVPSALAGRSVLQATGRPRLSRVVHEGMANEPGYEFINLEAAVPIFDLPLVKGDRIDL